MLDKAERRFIRIGIITLTCLFLLILAGGIVRSSGSGMGCPDWPRCFERWVPPANVSELPLNYQEIYKDRGYHSTEFNVMKTWTEYINRLIGAITGFVIFLMLVYSRHYLKSRPRIFWLSLATFLLTGLQAWIGGRVVQTNLQGHIITIHMLIALLIVAMVIYVVYDAMQFKSKTVFKQIDWKIRVFAIFLFLFTIVQVVFGTEVREIIDFMTQKGTLTLPDSWVSIVGANLEWHRSLAVLVLLCAFALIYFAKPIFKGTILLKVIYLNAGMIALQALLGFTLVYLFMPPVSQAFHIFVASLSFAVQCWMLLLIFHSKIETKLV